MMVASVAVVGVAFAADVQRGGDRPTFDPGVGGGNSIVVSQATPVVFRGEDDIKFVNRQETQDVDPSSLIGVSGDAEGQPLEIPIPQDQELGQYTVDSARNAAGVVVQQPRVTDLEVFNQRGVDVEGASVQEDETLLVRGEWNFRQAEDLSIEVRDGNGNEVTGDVLAPEDALSEQQTERLTGAYAEFPDKVSPPGQRGTGTGLEYLQGIGQFEPGQLENTSVDAAYWALDFGDQDAGDYTITVEGWDNLDFGPASRTTSISLTTENDVTLDVQDDEATRGQTTPFTIRGSSAGAMHVLTVEDDDFRNDNVDERVFRDVEDTVERGSVDANDDGEADFAYAVVEIDEDTGLGEGQIDTTYLDDTNVEVNLYDADQNLDAATEEFDNPEDDFTLSVQQGELTIDQPAGTYIAGQEVDVLGTAAQGTDDVAIYAREQGDWELLDVNEDGELDEGDLVNVDADGEWEQRDVVLSRASDILSIPGRYRFGVVEAEDVAENGSVAETLTTSEFSSATSEQTSIVVTEPGLGAVANRTGNQSAVGGLPSMASGVQYDLQGVSLQQGNNTTAQQADDDLAETRPLLYLSYNGQVATEDGTVDVLGTAPGLDDVLLVMIDTRGRVATERVTVDDNDVFEEDDVPLVTNDGRELAEGEVVAMVFGIGRDTVVGDGVLPGQDSADLAALEDYVQSFGTGLTQAQVTERILDETVGDPGSDDLFVRDEFRYTDGSTTIEHVHAQGAEMRTGVQPVSPGDTMVVRGLTNRKPDDNTIAVEALEGPSADALPVESVDQWGTNGVWRVAVEVPEDAEPGLYTIEADDGENTDSVLVRIAGRQAANATAGNATNATVGNATDGNVTAGNATAGNATEAGNATGANATAEESVLQVRGLGENATYSFEVSGEIVSQEAASDANATASGASGTIVRGVDTYRYTGEITTFELDGSAAVVVDGEEVDPAELGGNATNATNASVGGPLLG